MILAPVKEIPWPVPRAAEVSGWIDDIPDRSMSVLAQFIIDHRFMYEKLPPSCWMMADPAIPWFVKNFCKFWPDMSPRVLVCGQTLVYIASISDKMLMTCCLHKTERHFVNKGIQNTAIMFVYREVTDTISFGPTMVTGLTVSPSEPEKFEVEHHSALTIGFTTEVEGLSGEAVFRNTRQYLNTGMLFDYNKKLSVLKFDEDVTRPIKPIEEMGISWDFRNEVCLSVQDVALIYSMRT